MMIGQMAFNELFARVVLYTLPIDWNMTLFLLGFQYSLHSLSASTWKVMETSSTFLLTSTIFEELMGKVGQVWI